MNLEKVLNRYFPMNDTMFYILFSLMQERHGYGIMQHVKELTKGRIILGAGTVYSSLKKLEGDGLITGIHEEDRKKTYMITRLGMELLQKEAQRIKEIYQNLEGLL